MKKLFITFLFSLLVAATASAAPLASRRYSSFALQVAADVKNPTAVTFVADPDHVLIDSYELSIFRPDNTVLQTLNLGKPTPNATTQVITAALSVQPIAFGTGYYVGVRSKVGTTVSDYSLSENKFNRAPGGPSKVVLK